MSTPAEPTDETPEQTLARLQAAQATPGAHPDPSAGVRFPQVRLREGYDMDAVDAELDRWAARAPQADSDT